MRAAPRRAPCPVSCRAVSRRALLARASTPTTRWGARNGARDSRRRRLDTPAFALDARAPRTRDRTSCRNIRRWACLRNLDSQRVYQPPTVEETMRRTLCLSAALLVLMAGCASESGGNRRDTMTQRQRDSVLSTTALPGAQGVGKALRAADSDRKSTRLN